MMGGGGEGVDYREHGTRTKSAEGGWRLEPLPASNC